MKLKSVTRLALASATFFSVGCGVHSEESALREIPPPTRPAETSAIDKEELPYHLPDIEILQGWYGDSGVPDDGGEGSCNIGPEVFKVSVDGNRLTLSNAETIAQKECDGMIFSNIETKVETIYTCAGETWSDWAQGRQVNADADLGLTTTKLCANGSGSMSHYLSVSFTTKMPGSASASFLGVTSLRGEGNEGGCAFVADGSHRKMTSSCTFTSLSQMKVGDQAGTHFFTGVIQPGSAVDLVKARFTSGTVKAELGEWQGDLSFTEDAMSYRFESGGEVVKGSVPEGLRVKTADLRTMLKSVAR